MVIELHTVNNIAIIEPTGRLDSYTVSELKTQIAEIIDSQNSTNLIIDLADVTFMDSRALAAIVHGMHTFRGIGGDLCLAGPNQSVRRILELTRLDKAINIFADKPEALASYTE